MRLWKCTEILSQIVPWHHLALQAMRRVETTMSIVGYENLFGRYSACSSQVLLLPFIDSSSGTSLYGTVRMRGHMLGLHKNSVYTTPLLSIHQVMPNLWVQNRHVLSFPLRLFQVKSRISQHVTLYLLAVTLNYLSSVFWSLNFFAARPDTPD